MKRRALVVLPAVALAASQLPDGAAAASGRAASTAAGPTAKAASTAAGPAAAAAAAGPAADAASAAADPAADGASTAAGLTAEAGSASAGSTVAASEFEGPSVVEGNMPVFAEQLKAELDFPLAFGNCRGDFREWKRRARATVDELLWQGADRPPFAVSFVEEVARDGYRQRLLEFNISKHSRVRGTMLIPDGRGPFPGALLLHDHGAKFDIGKEKLIEPWYDDVRKVSAQAWADKYFSGRFVGNQMVSRGYAVLAVDALGWGDRGGLVYDGQQALASNLYNLGASLAGLMAREDARAAGMLATLPEVDPRRIAVVGFSMGGYRAWQVAALSDRIAATVSACWMTGLKEMMVPGNNTLRGQSAFYMLHPGLYRYLDIPDVASIAAPRPMMVLDGEVDPLFTPEGVAVAYGKMRSVWVSQRAGDRLDTKVWPGLGHVFVAEMQEAAFAWLDRWLKRG